MAKKKIPRLINILKISGMDENVDGPDVDIPKALISIPGLASASPGCITLEY
jgi:hypothetical protein